MVLSASLPSVGPGALKNREDPKILGTAKVLFNPLPYASSDVRISQQESGLLQSASTFYKMFAIECSRAQVSIDMFLFSTSYQDVASLGKYLTHIPQPR